MLVSTNSGYHSARPMQTRYTMAEMIDFSADAGFEALDINFCATIYQDPFAHEPILDGDWEANIRQLGIHAKERGLPLVQSHLPFYDFTDRNHPDFALREEMTRRSIIACGMLSIPFIVFHPLHGKDSETDRANTCQYLHSLVAFGKRHGVGIAMENMASAAGHFSMDGEGLAGVADECGCGICLDIGHANLTPVNQPAMIRTLGNRLKVLHIQDNKGRQDDHIPPFLGTIDWQSVMTALREIGYQGELNLEVANKTVPEALRKEYSAYLVSCGRLLRRMGGFE